MTTADLLILGGGLAGGLIATAFRAMRPSVRVVVLERDGAPGGNHTWSFHETDLDPSGRDLIAPFVTHRWPRHQVRFPHLQRRLSGAYCSVTSERFAAVLATRWPDLVRPGSPVAEARPTSVTLSDGTMLTAGAVIDARGFQPSPHLSLGWQVFRGLEVRLSRPVTVEGGPILMDATVPQEGGYRFVYTLPFAPDRFLIETTVYADLPEADHRALGSAALSYASSQGWDVEEVLRIEDGVLPITLSGNVEAFWRAAEGVPRAGLRAGLAHPVTGYSLPDAVRLALLLVRTRDLSAPALFETIRAHAVNRWREQAFSRGLNRMLFLAAEPQKRVAVLEHFHRLPGDVIARFYAGRSTLMDKLRIVSGRPPVPVGRAVGALATGHPAGGSL